MGFFGDLERLFSALYPYRLPITIGVLAALAGVAAFGYRKAWHLVIWRHRLVSAMVVTPVLALVISGGYFTLSPLFERSTLEESSPLVLAATLPGNAGTMVNIPASNTATENSGSAFMPGVVNNGEFRGTDDFHFGRRCRCLYVIPLRLGMFELFSRHRA